jgi:hypothetical protein
MLAVRVSLLAILGIAACGGSGNDKVLRSPSLDYPPPAAQTSDGEIVGADRMPPGDKLQEGPRAGSPGVTPAAGPGGTEGSGTSGKPHPCAEIGLEDSSGKTRCKKAPSGSKP